MRVTLVGLSLLTMLTAESAFAARKYGIAGCGPGSVLFGTGGMQTSAGTTNVIYGAQLFAISTGTSNCTPDSDSAAVLKQESFVVANYATLSKEMAQGQGQSVAGLAEVLGCDSSVLPAFGSFAQSKYESLFTAPGSMAMLDKLKFELSAQNELAGACKFSQIY